MVLLAVLVGVSSSANSQDRHDEHIIYPRSGQSAAQTEADRQECNRWATTRHAQVSCPMPASITATQAKRSSRTILLQRAVLRNGLASLPQLSFATASHKLAAHENTRPFESA